MRTTTVCITEHDCAGKIKRNFEIFSAEEFIAAITQHLPHRGFLVVPYYGWYCNCDRAERAKG